MPYPFLAVLGGLILLAIAALMVVAVRRAASTREELVDRVASHGWRYVVSHEERTGRFHVEGTSRAGAAWTVTCWSVSSDSRHDRVEFLMPPNGPAGAGFAIGSAKQLAMLPQFAAFTEQHPLAASLIAKAGSRVGGLLAIVSEGVAEPLGSPEFQRTFGAIRSREGVLPVRMTRELESLFLSWPETITDPGSTVTAWRDPLGLHVAVIAPAGPPFEIIEHLAELGEALGASLS